MKHRLRSICWIESGLGSLAALLAVITTFWPDWFERLFYIDPDGYSGSLERNLVVALWFGATLLAAFALRNWRRSLAA